MLNLKAVMKRKIKLYLDDLLESIHLIEEYTNGIDEITFEENSQIQDSVIRRLEIIGEAVKRLPEELKDKHPQIPWKEIGGLRDVLIHEYFGVSISRVWKVIIDDLPKLKEQIEEIIKDNP